MQVAQGYVSQNCLLSLVTQDQDVVEEGKERVQAGKRGEVPYHLLLVGDFR